MTKREVEEYLVHLAPKSVVSSGVRRRPVPGSPVPGKPDSVEACQPDLYILRFAADTAFMDKLQRAAEVSGVRSAGSNLAGVFEGALDVYLEKKDPRKRQERREKRAAERARAGVEVEAGKGGAESVATDEARRGIARSLTIPAAVRDRLLIAARHRCE